MSRSEYTTGTRHLFLRLYHTVLTVHTLQSCAWLVVSHIFKLLHFFGHSKETGFLFFVEIGSAIVPNTSVKAFALLASNLRE
jgi:hypothetical protein